MRQNLTAKDRIRWAVLLVDIVYFLACFVGGIMVLRLCVTAFIDVFEFIFFVGSGSWSHLAKDGMGDGLVSQLWNMPGYVLDFYMAKTARDFLKDLKVERLFSEQRQVLAHKYAILWVSSLVWSFVHSLMDGVLSAHTTATSWSAAFSDGGSGDLVGFVQQIVFLLVILCLYDAGVQLQKDMDEVV